MAVDLFDNWFDPLETKLRARAREFIEEMVRGELDTVLARPRYGWQMAGNEGGAGEPDAVGDRWHGGQRSVRT
jgi:putative transposase